MKFIFSLLLILSSCFSFGQMTMSEVMKIYKMDFDQFETYATNKGYQLKKFDRDEDVNGIVYVKGVGKQTKYLKLYDKFYSWGNTFDYETNNLTEVSNIKNQSINLGFKLSKTWFNENTQIKEYSNNKNILRIYTTPSDEANNIFYYEISLSEY